MKNIVIVLAVVAVVALGGWYYMSMTPKAPAMVGDATPTGQTTEGNATSPQDTAADQSNVKTATFTMADVAQHASAASCYSVIRGEVYDLTSWIGKHPGGEEEILQLCGKDGTDKFVGKHGGSAPQEMKLESFVIGKLAE